MADIDKLNKTYNFGDKLPSADMNQIIGKIDEVIQRTNENTKNIPDVSGFITETKADGKYATKSDLGDIETILDNIIGG